MLPHIRHADRWAAYLDEAEAREPEVFAQNGWVVGALQAAWSAITHTEVPADLPCRHLQMSLARAIGIGHDTDTLAAIAGALFGARRGASAVPPAWTAKLHGWNQTVQGLADLATLTVKGHTASGWPDVDRIDYSYWDHDRAFVPHPLVDGVWIGGTMALDDLPTRSIQWSACAGWASSRCALPSGVTQSG